MSKSLKKLIDINRLREFKNKLVGTGSPCVQTGAVDQTVAGTKTFSKPIVGSVTGSSGSCIGNAATATTAGAVSTSVAADNTKDLVYATMADNDRCWIRCGGASDAGYLEIATGDNGNDPIYVRQNDNRHGSVRTLTLLDGNGNTQLPGTVTAPTFSGNLTGNAATATQFSANATVALTGDATGTSAGSKKGWSVPVTLANSGVTAGTYGPSADVTGNNNATISVPEITVDSKGRVTSVVNRTLTCKNNTYSVYNKTLTIQKNGTNVATFTANSNTDVTANITVPTKTSELTNDSGYLTSHQSLSNYVTLDGAQTISGAKTFTGNIIGINKENSTEDVNSLYSTTVGSKLTYYTTSNSGTDLANVPAAVSTTLESRTIRRLSDSDWVVEQICHNSNGLYYRKGSDGTWGAWKTFAFTDSNISGNAATATTATTAESCTGNAASATKLQTARTINGTAFNGTDNITTANWGTARNISITDGTNTSTAVSVNGSANVSLNLPDTIKATFVGNVTGNVTGNCSGSSGSCTGNAATATKLAAKRTIALSGAATGTATNFDGSGNITIPVTALSGSAITSAITIYDLVPDGAANHRNFYRGKDITAAFNNGTVSANIANGTFKDIFPGDYITKQITVPQILKADGTTEYIAQTTYTVRFIIADLDVWLNRGDTATTVHHVAIVPQSVVFNSCMNETNVTTGGYLGSFMNTNAIPAFATALQNAFGASHLISFRIGLSNGVTTTTASASHPYWTGTSNWWGAWTSEICCLMSEGMVYGQSPNHSAAMDETMCGQFAAFRLNSNLVYNRQTYWLSDVVSSAHFAFVRGDGYADAGGASHVFGVRPFALLV